MLDQRRLNLSWFDSKTADLNLLIAAPDDLDGSIAPVSTEVARSIHQFAGCRPKRISHKAFGSEAGLRHIAAANTSTANQ